MIKVLHVLTDTNIGGAGTYIANYIKNYDASKVEPTVLVPRNSLAIKLFEGGCKIIEADIAPDKSLDIPSVKVIRNYIKRGGYDIVHAHGSASARIAAKGVCKSVFTKHTLSAARSGVKGMIDKMLYRFTGGYAIAVSEAAAQNLAELGFNKNKIFTVCNGVSDMGVPTDEKRAECKRSFGIDPSEYVIGCMARFSPEKDYATLIRAAAKVCNERDDVTFLLCGAGNTLDEMKALAKELGISRKCVFAGMVIDPQRAYNAMDLYCITSLAESFGQSLVEAWSSYLPSVTTDAKGFCEISTDGETSLICEKGNADQIADAILTLYSDKEKADRIAKNGNARFNGLFTAKTFAKNIETVYEKIK